MNFKIEFIVAGLFIILGYECQDSAASSGLEKFLKDFRDVETELKWIRDTNRLERNIRQDHRNVLNNKDENNVVWLQREKRADMTDSGDSWYNSFKKHERHFDDGNVNIQVNMNETMEENVQKPCDGHKNETNEYYNDYEDDYMNKASKLFESKTNEDKPIDWTKLTTLLTPNPLQAIKKYPKDNDLYYSSFIPENSKQIGIVNPNPLHSSLPLDTPSEKFYRDTLKPNENNKIIYKDQIEKTRNDLSHEANYKLSKIEQENIENMRNLFNSEKQNNLKSVQIENQVKQNKQKNFYKLHPNLEFDKRNVDPNHEIKLKISNRMISRGMSASLPSDSLDFNSRENVPTYMQTVVDEDQTQINDHKYKVPDYNLFKRENLNSESLEINKNKDNNFEHHSMGRKLLQMNEYFEHFSPYKTSIQSAKFNVGPVHRLTEPANFFGSRRIELMKVPPNVDQFVETAIVHDDDHHNHSDEDTSHKTKDHEEKEQSNKEYEDKDHSRKENPDADVQKKHKEKDRKEKEYEEKHEKEEEEDKTPYPKHDLMDYYYDEDEEHEEKNSTKHHHEQDATNKEKCNEKEHHIKEDDEEENKSVHKPKVHPKEKSNQENDHRTKEDEEEIKPNHTKDHHTIEKEEKEKKPIHKPKVHDKVETTEKQTLNHHKEKVPHELDHSTHIKVPKPANPNQSDSNKTDPNHINIKLEININNGTETSKTKKNIERTLDKREIRKLRHRGFKYHKRSKDPPKNSLDDLVSGKLPSQLVKAVFQLVKTNENLRKHIELSLKNRKLTEDNRNSPNLDVYKVNNLDLVQRTEDMMKKITETVSTLIEEQVNSRTCIPLRPDLEEFLEQLIGSSRITGNDDPIEDFEELPFPLKRVQRHANKKNKIQEKYNRIMKLISEQEKLTDEDQKETRYIKSFLEKHLTLLDELESMENENIIRWKRSPISSQYSDKYVRSWLVDEDNNDHKMSEKFIKLARTAEFIRKNILFDVERPGLDYFGDYQTFDDYSYL